MATWLTWALRSNRLLIGVGCLAAVATAVVPAAATELRAERVAVKTLVTVRGPIRLFAQDDGHIAWSTGCGVVVRDLSSGATMRDKGGPSCPDFGSTRRLALGGSRALWTSIGCGTACYTDVHTRAIGERKRAELVCCDSDGGLSRDGSRGSYVSGVAADGATVAYGVLAYGHRPTNCVGGTGPCDLLSAGGVVQLVVGTKHGERVSVPPRLLAASGSRLAIAPQEARGCICNANPSWSPDGPLIVFASGRVGPDTELTTVSPSGGAIKDITQNFTDDDEPDWSPDGRSLVYSSDDFGVSSIHVVGSEGHGERTLLSDCEGNCNSPTWSPDGATIAFESNGQIETIKVDGSSRSAVTHDQGYGDYSPDWSPDGREIVFTHGREIWTVDVDGSNPKKLTDGVSPVWSSSGEIAFERFIGGIDGDREIFAMQSDGTNVRQLTDNALDDLSPAWSPDGTRLVFVRSLLRAEEPYHTELFVMNADGTAQVQLTHTQPVRRRFPIEIRRTNGSLVSKVMPRGRVLALALSPKVAAVLVRRGHTKLIELFDPASGRRRGSLRLPRSTAKRLSADGERLVVSAGRRILLANARTRSTKQLAVTQVRPLGLSIEGRRVAWVESGRERSRIRALQLPRAG